jgi:hypothetical protein
MRKQVQPIFKFSFVEIVVAAILVLAALPGRVTAQQNNAAASSAVPQIIQFSGIVKDGAAAVPSGTVSITFTLYENEQGGTALWSETDNVQVDAQGHYTALLGSTSPEGLPVNLFTTVQAHWLAVQPLLEGYSEQPRVLLVSAPYALKAGDAETIGGFPASAFVKVLPTDASADSSTGGSGSLAVNTLSGALNGKGTAGKANPPTCAGGNNYIPFWHPNPTLCRSVIWETTATGPTKNYVGINNTNPGAQLDVIGSINTSAAYHIGGTTVLAEPGGSTSIGVGYQALLNNTGLANMASGYNALYNNTTGTFNTASGYGALFSNTTAGYNTASGADALLFNTTGSNNTASGAYALYSNTTGSNNTASGYVVLYYNTTGTENTASGVNALNGNTTGSSNTASGYQALLSNTTGSDNTASGAYALSSNTMGTENTATGFGALSNFNDTSGSADGNTASGYGALFSDTTGTVNTASGTGALYSNTTGISNTASGYQALYSNTTGTNNTASGDGALFSNTTAGYNTADGWDALDGNTTGNNNIAIGYYAAGNVSGGNSNNIHIGSAGSSADNGAIRIGTSGTQTSFFVAGARGVATGQNNAVPVLIDSNGQLGTISSSRRFKEDIRAMGDASEGLMRLRPVTFRYKKPFDDGSKPIQYGLIAEEVAEVYPDLVAHSADGQIETVKYQLLDPMLLNEVQREQKEMQRQQSEAQLQQAKIRDLEERVKTQQVQIKAQQRHEQEQQAQIAGLASEMKIVLASVRTRHAAGHARLASTKGTPAPTATDATLPLASSARGGN